MSVTVSRNTFFAALSALMLMACAGPRRASRPASGSAQTTQPDFAAVVFNITDTTSDLYLSVANDELLYKRTDTAQGFYAYVSARWTLRGSHAEIADSGTVRLFDKGGETIRHAQLQKRVAMRCPSGADYQLAIELTDVNRRTKYPLQLNVKKTGAGAQDFLVLRNDSALTSPRLRAGDTVTVAEGRLRLDEVGVQCFTRSFGPAPPPFSQRLPEAATSPDSVYSVLVHEGRFRLVAPAKGFICLAVKGGDPVLPLFVFDPAFPGLASATEMIECTRYIMAREEFDDCMAAPDRKAAIDNFWLAVGGSHDHGRELVKRYYSRVKEANRTFTSYREGWKTDRGMIFVVFGPPASMSRTADSETWTYGNAANPASLRFVFTRESSPYSDNEYRMERSPLYKDPWFSAVDQWRQGHVRLTK